MLFFFLFFFFGTDKMLCQLSLTFVAHFRYLLIENFIPPEEKNKIMNRLLFDSEEDQWSLQPVLPSERSVNAFHTEIIIIKL